MRRRVPHKTDSHSFHVHFSQLKVRGPSWTPQLCKQAGCTSWQVGKTPTREKQNKQTFQDSVRSHKQNTKTPTISQNFQCFQFYQTILNTLCIYSIWWRRKLLSLEIGFTKLQMYYIFVNKNSYKCIIRKRWYLLFGSVTNESKTSKISSYRSIFGSGQKSWHVDYPFLIQHQCQPLQGTEK